MYTYTFAKMLEEAEKAGDEPVGEGSGADVDLGEGSGGKTLGEGSESMEVGEGSEGHTDDDDYGVVNYCGEVFMFPILDEGKPVPWSDTDDNDVVYLGGDDFGTDDVKGKGVKIIDGFERQNVRGRRDNGVIILSDDEVVVNERRQEVEGVQVGEELVEIAQRRSKGKGVVLPDYVEPVGEVAGHPLVNVEEGERVIVCGLMFDLEGYQHQGRRAKKARTNAPPPPPRKFLRPRVVKLEPIEETSPDKSSN